MARRRVKNAILRVLMALLLPWAGAERLARRLRGRDVWFGTQAQFLSLIPGSWGVMWRAAYYHMMLRACPLDVGIEFGAMITHSETELGHRVYLGRSTSVGWAQVGDDALLADHVQVLSGAHHHPAAQAWGQRRQDSHYHRVVIGARCWIGANTVVMADVGEDCVIGAGAVVTRAVPDGATAVGVPARPSRQASGRRVSGR